MRMYYRGGTIPFDEVTREALEADQVHITDEDPDRQPSEANKREWGWTREQIGETVTELLDFTNGSKSATLQTGNETMRYISAAGIWMVTLWLDATVIRLPGDKGGDELVTTLLTVASSILTLIILLHDRAKKG